MTYEAIGTGATIEDARQNALKQLNAPDGIDVQIEILEMPVKKTFGLFGGSPAKVRAYYVESPAKTAFTFLEKILDNMGLENCRLEYKEVENGIVINLETEDYGLVIGRRGETLDALQYLTGLAANRVSDDYFRVTINTGDYREKREKTLTALARKNAIQVTRTGESITLEPMNPYERRIIHTAVQTVKGAESHSIGEDSDRRVVISLAEGFKPTGKPRGRGGHRGGYNKGGYRKGGYGGGRGYNKGGYRKGGKGGYNGGRQSGAQDSKPREKREPKSDTQAPIYGRIDK